MEIKSLIKKMKDINSALIDFIEATEDHEAEFKTLIAVFEKQEILKNADEIRLLFQLISKISDNHHRTSDFFDKLEKIFQYLIKDIPTPISYFIPDYTKYNKRILLLLLEKRFVKPDEKFINQYLQYNPINKRFSLFDGTKEPDMLQTFYYLYPKMKEFLDEKQQKQIEEEISKKYSETISTFEEKCQIGENDSYICSLIRSDSVEKFILYVNQINLSLSTKIKQSIYETNSFLIDKEPTLIEYAAFFGSIQIIQYLKYNKVPLAPSLWNYAIHSNNAELIHFLEENEVKPEINKNKELFDDVLKESIKCHHNDITNYIINNYYDQIQITDKKHFYDKFNDSVIDSFNFFFVPNEIESMICKPVKGKGFKLSQLCFFLTAITIPSSVTSIGDSAFEGCSSLTQITIPSSVTSIGDFAFKECSSLIQITIYEDIYLEEYSFMEELAYFINNLDDTTVYMADLPINNGYPPSCAIDENFIREFFQDYDFYWDSVKINTTILKNTKPCAFASIKFKTHEEAQRAINDLNYTKFNDVPIRLIIKKEESKNNNYNYTKNCIKIKNLDREIEASQIHDAFAKYGEIISCKMPISFDKEKNKYLSYGYCFVCFHNPEEAEQAMNDLKYELINGNPIEIEPISISIKELNYENLIKECSSSTQTTNHSSFKKIGVSAFSECSSLTQITIPSSVISIEDYAFSECSSLTQITIPSSVTSIGNYAFDGCSSLTQITIPSSVTSIGNYAFNGCSSLTHIAIPSSVTSIGDYTFKGCSSLTHIAIPSSVTEIGKGTFERCSSLTLILQNYQTILNAFNNPELMKKLKIIERVSSEKIEDNLNTFYKVLLVEDIETSKKFLAKVFYVFFEYYPLEFMEKICNSLSNTLRVKHPSILEYSYFSKEGFSSEDRPTLFTEFVGNSSLEDVILSQNSEFNATKKLINIYGIASAMQYLHSMNILHLDLTLENIIEDSNFYPKIKDFGMSGIFKDINSILRIKKKNVYLAPECYMNNEYDEKCDVYSFSLIAYQIMMNKIQFKGINIINHIGNIFKNKRPEFDVKIPEAYIELIENCWASDPKKRPTFEMIVDEIEKNPKFITKDVNKDEFKKYTQLLKSGKKQIRKMDPGGSDNDDSDVEEEEEEEEEGKVETENEDEDIKIELNNDDERKIEPNNDNDINVEQDNDINVEHDNDINVKHDNDDERKIEPNNDNDINVEHDNDDEKKRKQILQNHTIDINEYEKGEEIGRGYTSTVYEATKINQESFKGAAKVFLLKRNDYEKFMRDVAREVEYQVRLTHSSFIPDFIGYSSVSFNKSENPLMMTKLLKNGTLYNIVKEKKIDTLDDKKILDIIIDIASAMNYIHSKGIIHRDLKLANILLDESLNPKLSDFGLSMEDSEERDDVEIVGTGPYIAPEIWEDNIYSKASDVYAFGILVYELVTKKFAFEGNDDCQIMYKVTINKERPQSDSQIFKFYRELIESCWDDDPEKRPTFTKIIDDLHIFKNMKYPNYNKRSH